MKSEISLRVLNLFIYCRRCTFKKKKRLIEVNTVLFRDKDSEVLPGWLHLRTKVPALGRRTSLLRSVDDGGTNHSCWVSSRRWRRPLLDLFDPMSVQWSAPVYTPVSLSRLLCRCLWFKDVDVSVLCRPFSTASFLCLAPPPPPVSSVSPSSLLLSSVHIGGFPECCV